jgi:hypothetical protein
MTILLALIITPAQWQPVTLSWYTMGSKTADGTKMSPAGRWVATYREPLGAVLEVRVGKVVQTLTVRDRTAKKFGKRLDIPKLTWGQFGKPYSSGLITGEYRRIK